MNFPSLHEIYGHLLDDLAGADDAMRRAALTALSKLHGEVAAEVMFEQFKSDNPDDFLSCAISRISPDKAAHLFLQALNDSHPEARLAATDALSRLNSDEAIQVLTDAVEKYLAGPTGAADEVLLSQEALSCAVRALSRLNTPMCQGLLRRLLLKEANPRIRATIISAAIPWMKDTMLTLIVGFLKDQDSRVRANAIEAIQALKNPSTIAILQPYLYDPHQRVRANAIKAVWQYGDFEVSTALREMLAETDKRQRVSGIFAVGEIKLGIFLKNVLTALRDGDADIRRHAVIAIRKISSIATDAARSPLKSSIQPLLSDQEPAVRMQVVLALETLMGEGCFELLVKRLEIEKVAEVRSQIIEILGRLKRPETLGIIDAYLDDLEAQVVIAALDVISETETSGWTRTVVGSVRRCLRHADVMVRRKTVRVLWKLGAVEILDELCAGLRDAEPIAKKMILQEFGEVCAEVSATGGESLTKFQKELVIAVARHREKLKQSRHSSDEADAQKLWNEATAHLQAGRNKDAGAVLEELVRLSPQHVQGWMTLGDLAHRSGNIDQASNCFKTALSLQPNLAKAQYALGQIYHSRGEWKAATEALHDAIRMYPKLPQAYLLMAEAFEALEQPDDAFKALKRLAELAPSNTGVLQRLARAAFLAGDAKSALTTAREVEKLGSLDFAGRFIIAFGIFSDGNGAAAYQDLVLLFLTAIEQSDRHMHAELQKLLHAAARQFQTSKGTS
ncbi:MAG: HEAT repeat domain-containing protein [Candidatus Ozemobacteraceae bacterium]